MSSTVKVSDIAPAHVNGLKSAIHAVEVQITILKQLMGNKAGAATEAEEKDDADEEEEDDSDFSKATKKAGKKKAGASFEDEEEEEAEDEDEEEETTKKTASKKAAKVDLDDVNDACKDALERLGGTKKARGRIVTILKDDFDCEEGTVTELKPDQYAGVVKAMGKLK